MRYDAATKRLTLTVSEMAAYAPEASIRSDLFFAPVLEPSVRSLGFQTDVPFSEDVTDLSLPLHLEGRADTLHALPTLPPSSRIELIRVKKNPIGAHPRKEGTWYAEGLLLGFLCAQARQASAVTICYTFVKDGSSVRKSFELTLSAAQLRKELQRIFERSHPFLSLTFRHESETVPSIQTMKFPYASPREPQKELILEVFRALKRASPLVACAPTGVGKTMGVLYPAVRALGAGDCDKIFYLTAKTVTGKAAIAAIRELSRQVPTLRAIPLYAKERFCPQRGSLAVPPCFGCPMTGECEGIPYSERERAAVLDVLRETSLPESDCLVYYARKHSVCPYELSLDVSEWCDIVLCDYNYVFDDHLRLRRYFGSDPICRAPVLLIDEAHNLPERAREIFSARFSLSEVNDWIRTYGSLRSEDTEMLTAFRQLSDAVVATAQRAETSETDEEGRCVSFFVTAEAPQAFFRPLGTLLDLTRKRIYASHDPELTAFLAPVYTAVKKAAHVTELFDEKFRLYAERSGDDTTVRWLCLDPSGQMKRILSGVRSSVFFSATLSPLPYYADLFGCENARTLDLPSPFPPENLCLLCADYLSTRFSQRGQSADELADTILTMVQAREGHYLAYFPSYKYMKAVGRILVRKAPHIHYVLQQKGMGLAERDRFLKEMNLPPKPGETTLGLCVLGGIFSEGIDLKGNALIGVAVAGIGLGSLNSESNLLEEYYENTRESGKEYAYIYPGLNRILQAAGRVIRDEKDRGVVLLMDDRYDDPGLQKLFPAHWSTLKFVGNDESLAYMLDRFWRSDREKDAAGEKKRNPKGRM